MSRSFSLYLDLIRFAAATLVALYHVWPVIFPRALLPWPGHDAVIVFFVLSGYVISFAATQRESTAIDFAIHRTARVLSVAWPALVLGAVVTAICAGVGRGFDFAPIPSDAADAAVRSLVNAAFLGQVWLVDVPPPVNAPYWSLNFEVWYYVLFAVIFYGRGRGRIGLAMGIAALAGPRIIVLLPCWLVGVWLQRHRVTIPARWAGLGFAASILLYLPFFWFDLPIRLRNVMALFWPHSPGFFAASNHFPADYILTGIVALNFASAAGMVQLGAVLARVERLIRRLSSYTFSIYLYHAPLFVLLWLGLGVPSWLVLPGLALGIVVLGELTEARLPLVRALLRRWFSALPGRPFLEGQAQPTLAKEAAGKVTQAPDAQP